jgi:hypothetical protein
MSFNFCRFYNQTNVFYVNVWNKIFLQENRFGCDIVHEVNVITSMIEIIFIGICTIILIIISSPIIILIRLNKYLKPYITSKCNK